MKNFTLLLSLICIVGLSGCSKLMGGLRKDLDDSPMPSEPTVGGAWPEGGLLAREEAQFANPGHEDRYPMSEYSPGDGTWMNRENMDGVRRDAARGMVKYSDQENVLPANRRQYSGRATREDFQDRVQNEGSLWAPTGQTNYFFTENRVKASGDILKITMEDPIVRDISTEMKKTLSEDEVQKELELAQNRNREKAMLTQKDSGGSAAAKKDKDPKKPAEPDVPEATFADIDLTKTMGVKSGDTMLAEVVERYPNGNYKIRGTKRVPYPSGDRLVQVTAIAKSDEVEKQESIKSGNLYEYRLQVNQ